MERAGLVIDADLRAVIHAADGERAAIVGDVMGTASMRC